MFFKSKKIIKVEKQPSINRYLIDQMMKANPAASYVVDIGTKGKFTQS
jgi:hypothetical protein